MVGNRLEKGRFSGEEPVDNTIPLSKSNKLKIKKPNALVVIYNYKDRTGTEKNSKNIDEFVEIEQTILNSHSLKSVSTQKNKNSPAGVFEIRLAPYKNWVSVITPGSWCVILMSNYDINDSAKYGGNGKVDPTSNKKAKSTNLVDHKTFKMLGRIESVRGVINTNQNTGAKETEYIVTGVDWGGIFNSALYVDPLLRAPKDSPVGMPEQFGYTNYLTSSLGYEVNKNEDTKKPFTTSQNNIDFILSLWGRQDQYSSSITADTGIMSKAEQRFRLPRDLASYMGFIDENQEVSPLIAQIIKPVYGKLKTQDTYDMYYKNAYTDNDRSVGVINMDSILGHHTFWQVLQDNINNITNELVTDIRFEGNRPNLCLYNRVLPFSVNNVSKILADNKEVGDSDGATRSDRAENYISQYKNLRTIQIDPRDVIMSSFGTNWRDRVNFVEVLLDRSLYNGVFSNVLKSDSQFVDQVSISRDGLLPKILSTTYLPCDDDNIPDPGATEVYKYVVKECFFNTHKMLNGTLNLIGQDIYIQVGDNIMVDSAIVGLSKNMNESQHRSDQDTFLLAHVESISHNCTVDNNGSRIFTTTINFVRGIIVNKNKDIVSEDVGAVEQDASLLTPSMEVNRHNLNSSTDKDPDREKPIINDSPINVDENNKNNQLKDLLE